MFQPYGDAINYLKKHIFLISHRQGAGSVRLMNFFSHQANKNTLSVLRVSSAAGGDKGILFWNFSLL
jgi:hypothetical protein